MSVLTNFKKNKDFLICVDSDGCAMDTMNIKHIKCFGPCMIEEWNLKQWQDEILYSWNQVNLYTMTRGINRFKGLAAALAEVNAKYTPIDGVVALVDWAEHAPELSNNAVEKMIPENPIFEKALNWSIRVNEEIEALPKEDIKPFEGVKEALEKLHEKCDVAVVSSANPEAVKAEWDRYGLTEHVDILCTQDMGSKAHCISELLKKGYRVNNVLMCGDAVGDMQAAAVNGVLYYPICVNHEKESWAKITKEPYEKFIAGSYEGPFQNKLTEKFVSNLR